MVWKYLLSKVWKTSIVRLFVVEELDKEIAVQSDQRTAHSDEAENIADEGPANNGTHEY